MEALTSQAAAKIPETFLTCLLLYAHRQIRETKDPLAFQSALISIPPLK